MAVTTELPRKPGIRGGLPPGLRFVRTRRCPAAFAAVVQTAVVAGNHSGMIMAGSGRLSSLLCALALSTSMSAIAAIDVLSVWNYDDPAGSEARFRELARSAGGDDLAVLETQIARTFGLRGRFDEARDMLSRLAPRLPTLGPEARVRYQLEFGRTWISPVHKPIEMTVQARATARAAYLAAYELARQHELDDLAIDALHMLPFVDTDAESSLKWTRLAFDTMARSTQPRAKRWESMLRNNLGYHLHTQGKYDEALVVFQANVPVTEKLGKASKTRIAHWMVAWTLRSLGRLDEALEIQLRLEQENASDSTPDPFVYEELAHLYRGKGDTDKVERYVKLHAQQKRAQAK